MAGTSLHKPMKVNDLINELKNVPLDDYIEVTNSDGSFYIQGINVLDECTIELVLIKKPE